MGNGIFTRNYDNIMALTRVPVLGKNNSSVMIYSGGTSFTDGDLTLKDKKGVLYSSIKPHNSGSSYHYNLPFANIYDGIFNAPVEYGSTSLYLGSNNTEESYDDTILFSELSIYSTVSSNYDLCNGRTVVDGIVYDEETECFKKTIHYSFTANRPCTVGEMGFYWGSSSVFNMSQTFLVYRRAFEEPYQLETNDTLKIDFTVIVPANPNKPMVTEVEATVE